MKGFFAFVLDAYRNLTAQQLSRPLYILSTADEETTMAGARFIAQQQQIKPDMAIISEPTNLVPVVMHKGHMSHRILIKGQSGHSSKPNLGLMQLKSWTKCSAIYSLYKPTRPEILSIMPLT